MKKRFYYDCDKCVNQYTRDDGRKGCAIIDKSHGMDYPIVAISHTRCEFVDSCVCREYKPRVKPVVPHRTAVKKRVWESLIRQCSNCQELVYYSVPECPHCGAIFAEVEK